MAYRIIYCALGCASMLANLPHDSLSKFSSGTIEAVSDDVLIPLLTKNPSVPLLFFSREAYSEAMQGLSGEDTRFALQKRLESWSPEALDHAVEWLAGKERRILTLTARARREAAGNTAQQLESHFLAALDLLTSMIGTGRYDDMDFTDLLSAAIEKETLLIAELENSSEARHRTEFARTIAQELKKHGRPEFAKALPYAEPVRGVWIVPADPQLKGYLRSRGARLVPWRGGLVANLPLRTISEFEHSGKRVSILYSDAGAFLADAIELSGTQLERRLTELALADKTARERALSEYLNMLRLDLALLRRALRHHAFRNNPAWVPVLDRQIGEESAILEKELDSSGSWLRPSDQGRLLPRIKTAEEEVSADVKFLAAIVRARDNASLTRRLDAVVITKRADLERISNLRISGN